LDSGKYEDEVLDDLEAGVKAGVEGTPTFFINGYKVVGVISKENFRRIIEEIINQDR
jgi:protein-disulfide isomerase